MLASSVRIGRVCRHPGAGFLNDRLRQPTRRTISSFQISREQLKTISDETGIPIPEKDSEVFLKLINGFLVDSYDVLKQLREVQKDVKYPRTPGLRPDPAKNPCNGWYVKTNIVGAQQGRLAGKRLAVNDSVCVAGVRMMNGSAVLEGYMPDIDATVVTRVLDAGGTIAGKANCEDLCLSAGSHTNATGPVLNAHNPQLSAGGSSSGCAVLVASGEVDMAIATCQGAGIRVPASWNGLCGLKPTFGLVPHTGVMGVEYTLDTVGPITRNVEDNALLLEVLAGYDGLDGRQPMSAKAEAYSELMRRGADGLKVGVLAEGFLADSYDGTYQVVRQAIECLGNLGMQVEEFSIPAHATGQAIWAAIVMEGLSDQLFSGGGIGTGHRGLYVTSLVDYFSRWRTKADQLSEPVKFCALVGHCMRKYFHGHYYAKAQNLSRSLAASYDIFLRKYDLIVLPTVPFTAQPIPEPDATIEDIVERSFDTLVNASPFNITGHPALTIPCGADEGRPVGMMFVGRHWDEATIYRAAYAFEKSFDWQNNVK